jgi:hypothetical protein
MVMHQQAYPELNNPDLSESEKYNLTRIYDFYEESAAATGQHVCSLLSRDKRSKFDRWMMPMMRTLFRTLYGKPYPIKARPPRVAGNGGADSSGEEEAGEGEDGDDDEDEEASTEDDGNSDAEAADRAGEQPDRLVQDGDRLVHNSFCSVLTIDLTQTHSVISATSTSASAPDEDDESVAGSDTSVCTAEVEELFRGNISNPADALKVFNRSVKTLQHHATEPDRLKRLFHAAYHAAGEHASPRKNRPRTTDRAGDVETQSQTPFASTISARSSVSSSAIARSTRSRSASRASVLSPVM